MYNFLVVGQFCFLQITALKNYHNNNIRQKNPQLSICSYKCNIFSTVKSVTVFLFELVSPMPETPALSVYALHQFSPFYLQGLILLKRQM